MNNEPYDGRKKKKLFHKKAVTYFDGKTERKFFFILTIAILIWGIMTKIGLFYIFR